MYQSKHIEIVFQSSERVIILENVCIAEAIELEPTLYQPKHVEIVFQSSERVIILETFCIAEAIELEPTLYQSKHVEIVFQSSERVIILEKFYILFVCSDGLNLRGDTILETKATLKVVRTRVKHVLTYS